MRIGVRMLAAAALLASSAVAAYAKCGDHIMRLADGKTYTLVQDVTQLEGERKLSIGWEGIGFDIVFDGGELVQYGMYKADDDASVILVRCDRIGSAV